MISVTPGAKKELRKVLDFISDFINQPRFVCPSNCLIKPSKLKILTPTPNISSISYFVLLSCLIGLLCVMLL